MDRAFFDISGAAQGGLALAKEVYSPHLDMHQRLTILDALSTAARRLSSALPVSSMPCEEQISQPDAQLGERELGRSRRFAARSLAKQQEGAPRTRRNRSGACHALTLEALVMRGINGWTGHPVTVGAFGHQSFWGVTAGGCTESLGSQDHTQVP